MLEDDEMRTLELNRLKDLTQTQDPLFQSIPLGEVKVEEHRFPLVGIQIGSSSPGAPTLGLFGGVHGLERVGTHVVLSYLESLLSLLKWDFHLRQILEHVRIISIPIINPGGMALRRRANPNGVDLMRNSPVEAADATPLVGGHRWGPWLSWYRGQKGVLEPELTAAIDFIQKQAFESSFFMSADFHSGFGLRDRFWFPYARSKTEAFPLRNEIDKMVELFNETHPNHVYVIEPQSDQYITHGDLWDYLFDEYRKVNPQGVYLPWTLEMGSWTWVKKNPWQIFSRTGAFNPKVKHRFQRVMRRHQILIDFLLRATANHKHWSKGGV